MDLPVLRSEARVEAIADDSLQAEARIALAKLAAKRASKGK